MINNFERMVSQNILIRGKMEKQESKQNKDIEEIKSSKEPLVAIKEVKNQKS